MDRSALIALSEGRISTYRKPAAATLRLSEPAQPELRDAPVREAP